MNKLTLQEAIQLLAYLTQIPNRSSAMAAAAEELESKIQREINDLEITRPDQAGKPNLNDETPF